MPHSHPQPQNVHAWFPLAQQTRYIDAITGQSGLTRKQATCFVRLWGYAYLKQPGKHPPIKQLSRYVGTFSCSHREAADLFYSDQERGSERSAGQMIDKLTAKHLVKREPFDGGPTRLSLQIPDHFLPQKTNLHADQLYTEAFDVRQDTYLASALLEDTYSWVSQRTDTPSFKITQALRHWSELYPAGLRVLRQLDTDEPVGLAVYFPTHSSSEENFHRPPSLSLYLSTSEQEDPMQVASPGDDRCYAVFIRAWKIHWHHWNYATVSLFLRDAQDTLALMRGDFPNLSDMYSIAIHPRLEAFALALGFKQMKADPNSSLRWIYMSLDRFLALDVDETLVDFDFSNA